MFRCAPQALSQTRERESTGRKSCGLQRVAGSSGDAESKYQQITPRRNLLVFLHGDQTLSRSSLRKSALNCFSTYYVLPARMTEVFKSGARSTSKLLAF